MKKATKRKQKEVSDRNEIKQEQLTAEQNRQKFLKAKTIYARLTNSEKAKYEKQIAYPVNSPILKRLAITGLIARQLDFPLTY